MTDSRRPSDLAEKMMLRLPPGMRARIAEAAQESGRSANAEVVARLEKSFEDNSAAEAMSEKLQYLESQNSELWEAIEDLRRSMSMLFRG